MTGQQWFDLAKSILSFAFLIAGAGIVIALIGIIIGMSGKRRTIEAPKRIQSFGAMLRHFATVAFTKLMDPDVPGSQKITALGLLIFFIGILLLVVSIIPALVGVAEVALQGGSGAGTDTQTPTPTPTPTST